MQTWYALQWFNRVRHLQLLREAAKDRLAQRMLRAAQRRADTAPEAHGIPEALGCAEISPGNVLCAPNAC